MNREQDQNEPRQVKYRGQRSCSLEGIAWTRMQTETSNRLRLYSFKTRSSFTASRFHGSVRCSVSRLCNRELV